MVNTSKLQLFGRLGPIQWLRIAGCTLSVTVSVPIEVSYVVEQHGAVPLLSTRGHYGATEQVQTCTDAKKKQSMLTGSALRGIIILLLQLHKNTVPLFLGDWKSPHFILCNATSHAGSNVPLFVYVHNTLPIPSMR